MITRSIPNKCCCFNISIKLLSRESDWLSVQDHALEYGPSCAALSRLYKCLFEQVSNRLIYPGILPEVKTNILIAQPFTLRGNDSTRISNKHNSRWVKMMTRLINNEPHS